MQNLKKELIEAYRDNNYDTYMKLLDEYVNQGYGVEYTMVSYYITVLVRMREFDKAYNMIKCLEPYIDSYKELADDIARLYFYCFKPVDAERILLNMKDDIDLNLLVRTYLLQGKINEAEKLVNKCLKMNPADTNMLRSKEKIVNHKNRGAYIETEYSCFLNNGNKLEPGHIVFLKSGPFNDYKVMEDNKLSNRPYMIWKIDKDKVYIFPVTTKVNDCCYKLYSQNYPNSICDRKIKDNFFYTSIDNILSVEDKVLENDFDTIIRGLFRGIYYSHCRDDKRASLIFLKDIVGDINIYDILEIVDPCTRERSFYFVVNVDTNYSVVKINYDNLEVISNKIEYFNKNRLIYNKHRLGGDEKSKLLKQLPKSVLYQYIAGRRVICDGIEYIAICDRGDKCACVNASYTSSYVTPFLLDKNNISDVLGYVSKDEFMYIKKLIEENYGCSFNKAISGEEKKLIKNKSHK